MTVGSNTLRFTYDANGQPLSVTYNGTDYYYVTNIQGDVIGILDSTGNTVVTYTYNAWGNHVSTTGSMASTLGTHNPLRYRGYAYDNETKLYYLQSRYYNSEVGRFINADAFTATGQGILGNNMFAYCNNNPCSYIDSEGYSPETWQWLASGAMVLGGLILTATGVGGPLGGALIAAGVNSIVGSYASESAGGSSTAGWVGSAITGFICGGSASLAGGLINGATCASGIRVIAHLTAAGTVNLVGGCSGGFLGEAAAVFIDDREPDYLKASVAGVVFTSSASICSGIGTAVFDLPKFTTTSSAVAGVMVSAWSLISEIANDVVCAIAS